MHRTGSAARFAQALGLVLLVVYLVEIGLWRFLATAVLVAAFTAVVLGVRPGVTARRPGGMCVRARRGPPWLLKRWS